MTTVLEAALFYAGLSWDVFPCLPKDKKPALKWADEATHDAEKIKHWYTNGYAAANVGIATGARSGIIVVDIDTDHGGDASMFTLQSQHETLPKTPIAHTGGGGRHIIFKHPGVEIRNSAGLLGPGLDIRGDGGYIVAAPSVHPSGALYRWDPACAPSRTPLADMPQWLIDLLLRPAPAQPEKPQDNVTGAYSAGSRNSALASLAGSMQRRSMTPEAIYNALLIENKSKCVPPLDEKEVRAIAESVSRYDPVAAPEGFHERDRLHVEWAFAKTMFEHPINAPDFVHVLPEMFQTKPLGEFWANMRNAQTSSQAAGNAGILADLEKYENYTPDILDTYGQQLVNYAYLDKVTRYADSLRYAASKGDVNKIDVVVREINQNVGTIGIKRGQHISDSLDEVEREIRARAENPTDVWGIPYAFPYLSKLTGGKQKGELVLLAGEPKVGKSWWADQDALETALSGTPVFIWSGEMKRKQLTRRFMYLLGVNPRRARSGMMLDEDWPVIAHARQVIYDAPLYLDDRPLQLSDLKPLLKQKKDECGIEQFVIDYAYLVKAPGKDEIERTGNVSTELKNICSDLDLAGILITSVSKMGMDTASESVAKSSIRGSGQQIHDADVVYMLTKFAPIKGDPDDMRILPARFDNIVSLHVKAGRELDHTLPGGVIHYERMGESPKFKELKQEKEVKHEPRQPEPPEMPEHWANRD